MADYSVTTRTIWANGAICVDTQFECGTLGVAITRAALLYLKLVDKLRGEGFPGVSVLQVQLVDNRKTEIVSTIQVI